MTVIAWLWSAAMLALWFHERRRRLALDPDCRHYGSACDRCWRAS